jgi:hypothetical protein
MVRYALILPLLTFVVISSPMQGNAQESACQTISPARNQEIVLDRGGSYCLQADVLIDDTSPFLAHGRDRPGNSVEILSNDVTLDLQGHSIKSGDITYGIAIEGKSVPSRVTIRDGAIFSEHAAINSGLGNMVVPSDMGDPLANFSKSGKSPEQLETAAKFTQKLHESTFQQEVRLRPTSLDGYQQRDIHLERLHISARSLPRDGLGAGGAVSIQGRGTVIRDCVIETDAGNAIWIFGPGAVIENNTIIVHGSNLAREADAPIRLIQGDGAVIRNNKIVLRGNANKRGISTFDTGPIMVENNTFYGMSDKDDVAKAFLGTLTMRESGSKFEPIWKAFFTGAR